MRVTSGETLDVFGVAASDDSHLEFEGGCDDKCVDGVGGGHASSGEQRARTLGDSSRQFDYPDGVAAQELVDGYIKAAAATDLREYRRWDTDEGAALVSDTRDRSCPQTKRAAQSWVRQRIEGFRIED